MLLRNTVSILVLIVLGFVLTVNLGQDVSKLVFESNTRRALDRALTTYPGSYLDEVRFSRESRETIIRAVVRGPARFTAQQVARIEDQVPNAPNGSRPELRVRYIETTVITRTGLLYGPDDNTPVSGTNPD